MNYYSPLRYPGGKGRLAGFMKDVFRHNNLCDATYIEPYAGGAAVALTLLFEEYAWKIVINDIDRCIFGFWHTVLNETEWLLRKINDTKVNIDTWRSQKEVLRQIGKYDLKEIGFATLFLNRTNRSGILNAGVIGGKHQTGKYKIDARFNKRDLAKRIQKIAEYKNRIKVTNLDAIQLLTKEDIWGGKMNFFYFDPPYYNKGSMLYTNFYSKTDHEIISNHLRAFKTPWVLTYDNVPEVISLYPDKKNLSFSLTYTANITRKTGTEVMFYNDIELPPGYATDGSLYFATKQ